jgi:hypothetical protein
MNNHLQVIEIERMILRKAWWLFPVLGVLVSLLFGGPFWAWVANQPMVIHWQDICTLRSAILAAVFSLIPAGWRLGLKVRRARAWTGLCVLLVLCAAEWGLRQPTVQTALWLAVEPRIEPSQHFMREVCYVRLEENAGRATDDPSVIVVGSSQVLNGVDIGLLRSELQPCPVIRRAMFGMSPLKALAMQPFMPFQKDDTCLMYLSEFDFTNQDPFPYAWLRPYSTWASLPGVLDCIPWTTRMHFWRQVSDVSIAASTEWWRARDFIRQIAFHMWAQPEAQTLAASGPDPAAELAENAKARIRFSVAEKNGFEEFARRLETKGVALCIFEGDVNPALYSPDRLRAKAEIREYLEELSLVSSYRFVSVDEQNLELTPLDWLDLSNLNAVGRERLTRRMAEELRSFAREMDASGG